MFTRARPSKPLNLPPPVTALNPYAPLKWTRVLKPTQLKAPHSAGNGFAAIAPFRLNLLATHNNRLYLAASDGSIYSYALHRSNGLSVEPLEHFPIVPPSPINNIRFVNFSPKYGGPTLLMAGGDSVVNQSPGSLSVLYIPPDLPSSRSIHHRDSRHPRAPRAIAETYFLNTTKSAWGLHAHAPTGRVVLSTNSFTSVIFKMPEGGTHGDTCTPTRVMPPLASTHFGNIPSVAFSRTGNLLGSASIDTTFAIFDVSLQRAKRLHQSPQRGPDASDDAEWCWSFAWLSPRTPRHTHRSDKAWSSIIANRKSPTPLPLVTLLHDEARELSQSANAIPANERRSNFQFAWRPFDRPRQRAPKSLTLADGLPTHARQSPRKRQRVHRPLVPPPLPVYDDGACSYRDPFAEHRTSTRLVTRDDAEFMSRDADANRGSPVSGACSSSDAARDTRRSDVSARCSGPDSRFFAPPDNETVVQGAKFVCAPRTAPCYGGSRDAAQEPEDSLFVVARKNTLSLNRLLGRTGVEELDRLDPFDAVGAGSGQEGSRLSDVVELPELACVLVAEQYGGGVAVVRIVRRTGDSEDACSLVDERAVIPGAPFEGIRYILVVEGVIGRVQRTWMAGWCVIKRKVEGAAAAVGFEIAMVNGDGVLEVYEISRRAQKSHGWMLIV